ncbi:hypothetical protein RRF57_002759 [Xylaria bambusicola]|uniref:MYND-type domain-containing protein n=1 Tax=Xylaria bambusicola TaxID=326684 RepID=A0AAN7UJH2_9PEZI
MQKPTEGRSTLSQLHAWCLAFSQLISTKMLTTAVVNITTYFYPIGNTPAVSLTQTIPPGKPVDILLLGCGDVRNILFTSYIDARIMDITCCDNQKAVLARNILLLSILIDGNNSSDDSIWNLYYHMYIDSKSFNLLRYQAQKLYDLSASIDTWQRSKYGSRIRFCDTATVEDVRMMWEFYAAHRQGAEAQALKLRLDEKGTKVLTSYRAMIPAPLRLIEELDGLHFHYWEHGNLELESKARTQATFPNPMFLTLYDEATVHYGMDPLTGFHLALANVPFEGQDPLSQNLKSLSNRERIVATAKAEFKDWVSSYRKRNGNITLRFIAADATNLAYTIQEVHSVGANTAGLYRKQFDHCPLALNELDYVSGKAPLSFDVIDTSNLCDHFGSLVLFAATAPMLRNSVSSVLYTEVLAKMGRVIQKRSSIICFAAMLRPCLFPIDYWTNTSPLSASDEEAPSAILSQITKQPRSPQMYLRIRWKRPNQNTSSCPTGLPKIQFEADELAHIMYEIYLRMFSNEDYTMNLANGSLGNRQRSNMVWYHRASFASVVNLFKSRVICDWNKAMGSLIDLIDNRPMLLLERAIAKNYSPTFTADIASGGDSAFSRVVPRIIHIDRKWGDLRDWKDIPPVVCITLKVPRSTLRVFSKANPGAIGTPPVHCILKEGGTTLTGWRNLFAACHLVFGDGEKYTNTFEVHIQPADGGWGGLSSLIVTFYVPAFALLLDPRNAEVIFGIHSTSPTRYFIEELGVDMSVYKTTLSNGSNVFVTRHGPGQTRFLSAPGFSAPDNNITESSNVGFVRSSLRAQACDHSQAGSHIVSMAGRVDIKSENHKAALRSSCKVQARLLSAYQVEIKLGEESPLSIDYPVVLVDTPLKTRIARKSHWVEVVAAVGTGSSWMQYPDFMYPVQLQKGEPVNLNMAYLNLQKCPIIDIKQQSKLTWLNPHLFGAISQNDRKMYQNTNLSRSPGQKVRLDFKESIFSILVKFCSLQGAKKYQIFGLDNRKNGGIHVIIMASKIRIDLSNRAVVLDCAVLPLYDEIIGKLANFLGLLTSYGLVGIQVDDEEMQLWKHVIPAYVERCRQWQHQNNCEYATASQLPLTLEQGKKFMCTCGNGNFPDGFLRDIPNWKIAWKYAVRAAISPPFWAPFADEMYIPDISRSLNACGNCGKLKGENGKTLLTCGRCKDQRYCSPECQKAHWRIHKEVCK